MTDKTLGGYIRTTPHPDDMDGGVTAALIEKEATDPDGLSMTTQGGQVWITCTAERHEVTVGPLDRRSLAEMVQDRGADESRPLTPDAITNGVVARLRAALVSAPGWKVGTLREDGPTLRRALTAALTEPAEDPEVVALAKVLGDFAIADEHSGDRDDMILARRLHERGVRRVTTEEQS